MKVIMAVYRPSDDKEAEIVGQVRLADDHKMFINDWLAKLPDNARFVPKLFKVYSFERGSTIPSWFGTERLSVQPAERCKAGQVRW